MRIVRFKAAGKIRFGVVEGTHVVEYAGTPFGPFRRGRKKYPLRQTVLLVPVVPSKIVAVGLNYRDHAEEMHLAIPAEPRIFFKPPSALCGPDDPIVYPACSGRVDFEAELAVVIKKRCRNVPPERAREHVLGYTCLNDVTARDLQTRDGQPSRAKAFDTFCPVGPCIATDIDPNGVEIEAYLNFVADRLDLRVGDLRDPPVSERVPLVLCPFRSGVRTPAERDLPSELRSLSS